MSVRRRAGGLLRRARAAARDRRPDARPEPGAAGSAATTVSVVMPVLDTIGYLAQSVESVLGQVDVDVELVAVDDGSTDGSLELLEALARDDPRVTVLRHDRQGPGTARNAGIAAASGTYLSFVDSDDLLRPGALRHLVRLLERSGSDFASGSYRRGPEATARTPAWVLATHATRRTGLVLDDHPQMLLDITPCNKVFRRSFWDDAGLAFPDERRYEDQVPMTRAFLVSTAFDVTSRDIYLWRTRDEGSSITQQKARIEDLRDRIRSQLLTFDLVRELGSRTVQDTWFHKVLGFDLPGYVESAMGAGDEYWRLLGERLAELRAAIPLEVMQQVALYPRLVSYLVADGERDAAEALFAYNRENPRGWPLEPAPGDGGGLRAAPPLAEARAAVPDELWDVCDVDVVGRAVLTAATWTDDTLVLDGLAFCTGTDPRSGPTTSRCRLVDRRTDRVVDVPTEPLALDPRLADQVAARDHEDHTDAGFRATVDLARLAATSETSADWEVAVDVTCGPWERTVERPTVLTHSSVTLPAAVRHGDRLVRLAGDARSGIRVRGRSTWSRLLGVEDTPQGRCAVLDVPPGESVESVVVRGEDADRTVAHRSHDGGATIAVADLSAELATGEGELWVRLGSGEQTALGWTDDAPLLGLDDHASLRCTRRWRARLVPADAGAWIDTADVEWSGDRARLRVGGHRPGPPSRLHLLRGERVVVAGDEVPTGRFEVSVPLHDDAWGLGDRSLPEGGYALVLGGEDGDDPHPVLASAILRRAGRLERIGATGSWSVVADREARVHVQHDPRPDTRPRRAQARLQEVVYADARQASRRPAALFECFSGRTAGDSPAAVAAELAARGTDLDLVWSVSDHAVVTPAGVRPVVRETPEWFDLLGRAELLVNNGNFPVYFAKADGQVHVQTWHGTPLKRIGHDVTSFADPLYLRMLDREAARWDLLLSPSPYCTSILQRALTYDGEVLEAGYPRNDALVGPGAAARREQVRAALGLTDRRVVLYAPTWREDRRTGGYYTKVLHLEAQRLVEASPGTTVLVRGHANAIFDTSNDTSASVVDVTAYPDVNDLLLASDALVTDYSSLMFDYCVLDRPIVLLVPDLDAYRDSLRGFYFDLETHAPGPLVSTTDEVLAALDGPDAAGPARAWYRREFTPLDDGHAAARVVDRVLARLGTDRS